MKVNPEIRKKILRLRKEGWGKQALADKFDLSRSTIRRVLDPDYAERMRDLARGRRASMDNLG